MGAHLSGLFGRCFIKTAEDKDYHGADDISGKGNAGKAKGKEPFDQAALGYDLRNIVRGNIAKIVYSEEQYSLGKAHNDSLAYAVYRGRKAVGSEAVFLFHMVKRLGDI